MRAIYISCDPDALARDLKAIAACGYAITSLQPVDVFPHTHHIETVAVLIRESNGRTHDDRKAKRAGRRQAHA